MFQQALEPEGDDIVKGSADGANKEAEYDSAGADVAVGMGKEVKSDEEEDGLSSTTSPPTAMILDCPITPTQAYVSSHKLVQTELTPMFHLLKLAIVIL